jgi:hypothetical protein
MKSQKTVREETRNKISTKLSEHTVISDSINPYLSTITLKINGLNFPIKMQRMTEWIEQHPTICCLLEIVLSLNTAIN